MEWLCDWSVFYVWFLILVIVSMVVIIIFGLKFGFLSVCGIVFVVVLMFMLFVLLCNLVCVWLILSWKYCVSIGIVMDVIKLWCELVIMVWFGVIVFVSGLILGIIGNFGV